MLRENYPKPNLVRPRWTSLDGEWEYSTFSNGKDDILSSCKKSLPDLTRIGENYDYALYKKTFVLTEADSAGTVFLNIGSVDGDCEVLVNNKPAGKRKGAPSNLTFDITNYVVTGENSICIFVMSDPLFTKPTLTGSSITGRIWLEFSAKTYISQLIARPSITDKSIYLSGKIINLLQNMQILAEVTLKSKVVASFTYDALGSLSLRIPLPEPIEYWQILNSNLYEIKITLVNSLGGLCDCIHTYTAFREIEIRNNLIYINNKNIFFKLVKDNNGNSFRVFNSQKIRQILSSVLALGFNGIDLGGYEPSPQFLYLADKLGITLFFSLIPNGLYPISEDCTKLIQAITASKILRYIASPSIILWNLFFNFDPGADFIAHMISMCKKYSPSIIISSFSEKSVKYGDFSSPYLSFVEKSDFLRLIKTNIDNNSPSLINFSSGSFLGAYSPFDASVEYNERDFSEIYTFMNGTILASNSIGFSYDFLNDSSVQLGGFYTEGFGTKISRNILIDIRNANSRRSIGELNSIIVTN